MAAFADGFDDFPDEDPLAQPLPAEDRLWRHPSELGSLGSSLPLDPITVRRRWLASQPSRASAWTAGLVGALLATGLVALGTHLASAITARPGQSGVELLTTSAGAAATPSAASGRHPMEAIGTTLATHIAAAGKAVFYVDVTRQGTRSRTLGIGIGANGMLLAPAAQIAGATSIVVVLPNGASYIGDVVGTDFAPRAASSGLALLHVSGVTDLPVAPLSTAPLTAQQVLAVAVSGPGGSSFSVGSVATTPRSAPAGSTVLVDAMSTDLPTAAAPPGSMLLGGDGRVLGIVTGSSGGKALATPAWIATDVAAKLASEGAVVHGWLGIEGTTAGRVGGGVAVGAVARSSAASTARLLRGDIIVSVDGHSVTSMAQLQGLLYLSRPGQQLSVGVVRDGHPVVLHVSLEGEQHG
ncbi:MAG: S1C family serine protease [Acidimicrobiales bacterium]